MRRKQQRQRRQVGTGRGQPVRETCSKECSMPRQPAEQLRVSTPQVRPCPMGSSTGAAVAVDDDVVVVAVVADVVEREQ